MATLAETDRLIIRDWLPQHDAESAFEIYGDPDVMRFIGSGKTEESVETQQQALQRRVEHCAALNNGSGFWAIVVKATQDVVGAVILKQLPDNQGNPTSDYEIGWHQKKAAWGNGYVTEAAKALLDYGFNTLNLPVIYAVVRPENGRSIRVTQRLGMTPLGRTHQYYGVELELFKLEHPSHV